MTNIQDRPDRVQTIEGVVVERYPYEDAPTSVQAEGAYHEGVIDGVMYSLFVVSVFALLLFALIIVRNG
jgi:hypothetical protein